MPIPQQQLQQLEDDLRGHESRLTYLNEQIGHLQAEALAHETLVALGRDNRLIDTLNELYDHPERARELADQPRVYTAERDVNLPEGARIHVIDNSPDSLTVQMHVKQGPWKYTITWDRNRGFRTKSAVENPSRETDEAEGP